MSAARLAPSVEVAALRRLTEQRGDMATVIRRGDPDRGTILLQVLEKGRHFVFLERLLGIDGQYRWERSGPDATKATDAGVYAGRRAKNDEDLWLIELDTADGERFIVDLASFA